MLLMVVISACGRASVTLQIEPDGVAAFSVFLESLTKRHPKSVAVWSRQSHETAKLSAGPKPPVDQTQLSVMLYLVARDDSRRKPALRLHASRLFVGGSLNRYSK